MRVKPVQARAIQTVEHILRTAADLLAEVGVDQFNTNLLAERADVRVRTVYRYFLDKHAVILCLAERMYQRADESLTRTLRVV
ncbi:MAG: helix-turn-helix transcriptional regulator, partial [Myxococcales bacterium]|nr:helix-turn-helix transcriptional regulator [Myxococcales bacterium]